MDRLETTRSVLVHKFGGYDSICVKDFQLPPLDDNIEVEVHYGGLNFADLYTRQGLINRSFPFVLGMECSGKIINIGSKVSEGNLKVGQSVICYNCKGGMYRKIVRVSPNNCFVLPDHIDSKVGASIFVNYVTAWFSLIELGNLKENESVLILSCAGGVGIAATQIAKTINGVKVFGSASSNKKENVEQDLYKFLSKDTLMDDIEHEKFDLILTNECGMMFNFLQNRLNPLGRIIIIGANNLIQNEGKLSVFTLFKAWWTMKPISAESLVTNNRVVAGLHIGTLMESNMDKVRNVLGVIFELIKDKRLNPVIDSVWPMSEVVNATKLLAERRNIGKVLISMRDTV